jgi:hypothetical protein
MMLVARKLDEPGIETLLRNHQTMLEKITAAAAIFLLAGAAHAQLTETEQRITAAVKQRTPAALELLEKSVRINSGTLNRKACAPSARSSRRNWTRSASRRAGSTCRPP